MTDKGPHLGRGATIVVPATDQDAALDFYAGVLAMQTVNDVTQGTCAGYWRGRNGPPGLERASYSRAPT